MTIVILLGVVVFIFVLSTVSSAAAATPTDTSSDDTSSDDTSTDETANTLLSLGLDPSDTSGEGTTNPDTSIIETLMNLGLNSSSVNSAPSDKVQSIAQAIASAEGFGPTGAIPTKANNPGDICAGDVGCGVIVSSGGEKITVYASTNAGWNALYNQVSLMCNGQSRNYSPSMTWSEIGAKYAGPNTPWAQNVANNLGVNVDSTLADYLAS